MPWNVISPGVHLGWLPSIFLESDPRPAKEQAQDRYRHGGGWVAQMRWRLAPKTWMLAYPGDPPLKPKAVLYLPLTNEHVAVYDGAWVAIVQASGEFEVGRMD